MTYAQAIYGKRHWNLTVLKMQAAIHKEDICLQTLLLLFKYANHKNKRFFVLTANETLVGTLMTIGDVNNILPIGDARLQVVCFFKVSSLNFVHCF